LKNKNFQNYANEPAATLAPTEKATASVTDTYFMPAVAGIIVAIVLVGALTIVMLRKKP
jgi:hypothetical protein